MSSALLYRIAAVLLLLFATGHTMGFHRVEPRWGIDTIVSGMRTTRFVVQGMTRTYWDFYMGFGLFVTVLLLFTAILAWQLGGLPAEVLRTMPLVRWGLALCFIVVTYTSWRYFFVAPIVFSAVIAVCLILAAWRSAAA